jgi:hypothetical protein
MIYLLEPSYVLEATVAEYFSYSRLSPEFGDELTGGEKKVVVYDCLDKDFDGNLAERILNGANTTVFVVLNDTNLGFIQSKRFKMYNHKGPIGVNPDEFKKNLIHKLAWLLDPEDDFDHVLYLDSNPNLLERYYNTPWARENNISDRQRAYHHYLLHGSDWFFGSKENLPPEKILSMEVNDNLKKIVNSVCPEIKKEIRQNRLECVCLNMTSSEKDGYETFAGRILASTNKESARDIDFVIVVNNDNFKPDVGALKNLFKSVVVISLNLTAEQDIYVRPGLEDEFLQRNSVPDYGLKAGPNIMFLRSMEFLRRYNTSLLVETDCHFGKGWLGSLRRYTRDSNGFLVSGSTYDGVVYTKANTANFNHLNGVALYATGDSNFQALMRCFDGFLKEHVRTMPHLAYDFGMKLMVDFGLDHSADKMIWNFINRNIVVNKHIFNFSTLEDSSLDEGEIRSIYNYAVLHKKG